ncbi:MAG: hypothetical protein V4689_01990 [Verrucomicrobiota bacterium]
MNFTLTQIIGEFRQSQDRAVATIRDDLNWKLPPTNCDWVFICGSEGYNYIRELKGIKIYTHGYGIELTFPDMTIDFDWGDQGEGTGFDTWRLWSHCELNNLFLDVCTHDSIRGWLEEAHNASELVKDRLLWYRPHERRINTSEQNKPLRPTDR